MTATTKRRTAGADRSKYDAVADRGCRWSPRCTSCIWAECVPEMTPQRRGEFLQAYHSLAGFLQPADRTIA